MIRKTSIKTKAAAFLLVLLLAFTACTSPLMCSAVITTYSGTVSVLPGNTRSLNPTYNYAWLDNVIVRDDVIAITPSELVPYDSYPYSMTFDEFLSESEQYMVLFDLDVDSVSETFNQVIRMVYYLVVALGLTDTDYQTMCDYLTDYGINYTSSNADLDLIYTNVLYACIKNNAFYVLYGKDITIPKNISLEYAIVILLAEALGIELPSGITTITGLALLVMRSYISDAGLPISDNPSDEEGFYWAKISTAAAQDYAVPTVAYNEATDAQSTYVDYAYCASILKLKYDITIHPLKLCAAMNSDEDYAVQKLILTTMLDEKNVSYSSGASVNCLFEMACQNGYFELENEFYSDIYTYDVTVASDCEKLWLSPFALSDQLDGGDLSYLSIKINGVPVAPSSTTGVVLDTSKSSESVVMAVAYNDGAFRNDTATYTFRVHRSNETPETTTGSQDLVGTIQGYISEAIPEDNVNAQERVSNAFETVDSIVNSVTTASSGGVLTTYSDSDTVTGSVTTSAATAASSDSSTTTRASGFTTYGINESTKSEIKTSTFTTYPSEELTAKSVAGKALTAITENPVATATPVSLIAIGTAVGLIFNRRKRERDLVDDSVNGSNGEENSDNTED